MLKCKECCIDKELSGYYRHPQWRLWVLSRCKDCIKKWRKSEREKEMARIRDKDRYYNNQKRRKYCFDRSSKWAKDNPVKRKAQSSVNNYYKKHWLNFNMYRENILEYWEYKRLPIEQQSEETIDYVLNLLQ